MPGPARPALGVPVGTASARGPVGGDDDFGPRQGLSLLGRVGLAGRTGFYAVLTGITVRIAMLGHPHHQADAAGALNLISRPLIGKVAIGAVAVGFVLFGIGRLIGAHGDRSVSMARRAMTALQGLFYLAVADVPVSYLLGNHRTGSQGQNTRTTAMVLRWPGGRELLVAVGLVLIVVCVVQIRGGLSQQFTDGLAMQHAGRFLRAVARVSGAVGITARALVFVPMGVGLIVAGVEANAGNAVNTDTELLDLAGHPWGVAVLCLVAAGLATFCCFSAIETRYREVISAR
ncbi:MAG TPA: DUF1206 domain-containing protein [Acidimicrobiales bacterium]|nr:DUF1206 domain-containing protein [Acidimicrobiales bacterium]